MAGIAMLAIAGASWWMINQEHAASLRSLLKKDAELQAAAVSNNLREIAGRMSELANNRLIGNALVDSAGKEQYVIPFLSGIQRIHDIPVDMLFTDFEGREIARNGKGSFSEQELNWLREKFPAGQAASRVQLGEKGEELLAVEFIFFSRSNSVEGALLYRIKLDDLSLQKGARLVRGPESEQLLASPTVIAAAVNVPPIYKHFDFAVLTSPDPSARSVDWQQLLVFFILAVGMVVTVIILGLHFGKRLTRDLGGLEVFARGVSEKGFGTGGAEAADSLEVASLAQSINSMLERLKQQHDRLHESEERFRSIFEYSKVGMSVMDADSRYLEVNPAFVEMTGYSEEELLRRSFREITHPDDVESGTAMAKTLLTGESDYFQIENKYIRKDGSTLWADVTASAGRDDAGKFVSVIGISQDITERKRTEAALQQELVRHQETARELFDARVWLAETDRQEAVGRLAAGVAHEVKNPLAIIRLGIDYLSKEFARESTQGAVLGKVQQAIMRADSIITNLLQFSRQTSLARHPTQINAVIDNAINLISHEIALRSIDVVRSYDDSMPPILADPDQLAQVFVNLLSNAAQAIGQGGRIEVVARSICLSVHDLERDPTGTFKIGERVITAEIKDNGPGVSREQEKRLFEPFFTTKPIGEGTGLGLAVSRNIVTMHEGSINLANRPEGGASVLLMFPVDRGGSANEAADTGGG